MLTFETRPVEATLLMPTLTFTKCPAQRWARLSVELRQTSVYRTSLSTCETVKLAIRSMGEHRPDRPYHGGTYLQECVEKIR
jgi:hypothetical protein